MAIQIIQMINKKEHKYRVMSRLVREIAIMEVLDHQNVVKLYETYETADTLYIIMEYVKGYNLEEYLKSIDKSIIPEDQARDIFRQVIKAVDHCHSKWIVHRDLKVCIRRCYVDVPIMYKLTLFLCRLQIYY